jgi:hypothetical protein
VNRGIRGVGFMTEVLNPFRHPFLLFQIISHRLLRWGIPFLLIGAFVSNAFLLDAPFYQLTFAAQLAFYGGALAALVLDRSASGRAASSSRSTSVSSISRR